MVICHLGAVMRDLQVFKKIQLLIAVFCNCYPLEVSSNDGPSSLETLLEERTDSPFLSTMWAVLPENGVIQLKKKSVQIYKIKPMGSLLLTSPHNP